MPQLKVTTWNIEHMHDWFDDTRANVITNFQAVATKAANVINAVDPDILCIQEGPNRKSQIRNFFTNFVGGDWSFFQSDTSQQQRSYIAVKDNNSITSIDEIDFIADAWKYPFLTHTESTRTYNEKLQRFTRLPVELLIHTSRGAFSVMCLHVKSKFSRISTQARSSDPVKRSKAVAEGLEQRARILQEAKMIREYVQDHPFRSTVGGRILITGDLNDGEGEDFFEERFFGTDLVERITGDVKHLDHILTHLLDGVTANRRFTAIFFDRLDGQLRKILLDHLMATPELMSGSLKVDPSSATIEHTAYLAENTGNWTNRTKPDRQTYPSDHRPASVLVTF